MLAHELADLLETLVNIPSLTGQETAIARWVSERLRRGARGEVIVSGRSAVWRWPSRGRPRVLLAGHLDTVPGDGIPARRENGRLVGLGSSDMKAGDAVLLALLERLDLDALSCDLAAVFYDAEEGPLEGNGLRRLLGELPWLRESQLAVLLEPTGLKVEMGCIGTINAEVRVRGRRAHSARPWLGVNAVERAAAWLAEITRYPVTAARVQGLEYRETLQITTLQAGVARNVVPEELVANLNYRYPPDRDPRQAEAKLRSLIPEGFEVVVVDSAPPGRVCLDDPRVKAFVERHGLQVAGKQGWTDVAQLTQAGVPAFNFGPGIPEQAHQPGEYCPLENLEPAYRYLAGLLGAESE